jgi:exopolyphosphatase/guanosine-5'-triphosphate,3'-diphosphate pyrophosphatase
VVRFAEVASMRGVHRLVCCATSAIREAENGADLCDRIEAETGVNPRVISGAEEAELIYRAVRHTMGGPGRHLLGFDIGGGSVEIMLGDQRELHWATSLRLGVARLAAAGGERDEVEATVRAEVAPAVAVVAQRGFDEAIGTSGTIEDLATAVAARRGSAVPDSIDHYELAVEDLAALETDLWGMRPAKRGRVRGIDPRRADLVHVGATLLRTMLEAVGAHRLRIGTWALREGMLLEALADIAPDVGAPDRDTLRREGILALLRRYQGDEWHARHVARLALQLFDGLAGPLGAGAEERRWLEEAALLHDIGSFVSASGHHRHSAYLISSAGLRGIGPDEVNVIASVARGHSGGPPRERHETYAALPPPLRAAVDRLAAILRVAEGLDRGHGQRIAGVQVTLTPRRAVIETDGPGPPDLELWGARRKKGLLERLLGQPVEVVPRGYAGHPSVGGAAAT